MLQADHQITRAQENSKHDTFDDSYLCGNVHTGSTQDEVSSMVQATMQEGKISGNDRAVAWDGQTQSGAGLANQMKAIAENRVRPFKPCVMRLQPQH